MSSERAPDPLLVRLRQDAPPRSGRRARSLRPESTGSAEHAPLTEEEVRLLAVVATGVTTDVAARRLGLSSRVLRRRLRTACDRLGVNTPIEAVVWAARRQLI